MRETRWILALMVLIAFGFLLNACGSNSAPVEIQTPFGVLQVVGEEIIASYPKDCTLAQNPCFIPDGDHQLLVILFKPKTNIDPQRLHLDIYSNAATASITTEDGTKTIATSGGSVNKEYYLAFYVPNNTSQFIFSWFENNPILLSNITKP